MSPSCTTSALKVESPDSSSDGTPERPDIQQQRPPYPTEPHPPPSPGATGHGAPHTTSHPTGHNGPTFSATCWRRGNSSSGNPTRNEQRVAQHSINQSASSQQQTGTSVGFAVGRLCFHPTTYLASQLARDADADAHRPPPRTGRSPREPGNTPTAYRGSAIAPFNSRRRPSRHHRVPSLDG